MIDKKKQVAWPLAIGVAVGVTAAVGGVSYALFGRAPEAAPTTVQQAASQIDPQQLADQRAADERLEPRQVSAD